MIDTSVASDTDVDIVVVIVVDTDVAIDSVIAEIEVGVEGFSCVAFAIGRGVGAIGSSGWSGDEGDNDVGEVGDGDKGEDGSICTLSISGSLFSSVVFPGIVLLVEIV